MIELTKEQHEALQMGETPPRVHDPMTQKEYFLISADAYKRLVSLLGEADPEQHYQAFAEAAWEEWDDPALDVYEKYRRQP